LLLSQPVHSVARCLFNNVAPLYILHSVMYIRVSNGKTSTNGLGTPIDGGREDTDAERAVKE